MVELKIVERARKILALARDAGAAEGEVSNALALLQDMLQEHGLSMAEVEAGGTKEADSLESREKFSGFERAGAAWQRKLMGTLAENNFCAHWVQDWYRPSSRGTVTRWDEATGDYRKFRRSKRHVLIGRVSNVAVTRLTYEYLTDAMDRLLRDAGLSQKAEGSVRWLEGCADRLCERLVQRRQSAEQASSSKPAQANGSGRELMTLTDLYGSEADLNDDFRRCVAPGTTAQERRERQAEEAERRAARDEKIAALVASGMDPEVARYVAAGHSQEAAERIAHPPEQKEETAKQRAKRERRDQAWWDRYQARQNREYWRKEGHPAYRAGQRAADDIGLDDQLSSGAARPRLN